MLMAQSDSRFGYTAKLSRSDHDLGRPFGFTCAPGMLLPIHADILSPGDSVYVEHDLPFMRTTPLAAPAMVDVKVHFETFFVPIQLIYQPAENTLTSINQQYSSFYNFTQFMNNNFPLFDYNGYIADIKTNHQNQDIRAEAFRLADMLGLNAENFCTWHGSGGGQVPQQPWLTYAPSFFPWQILTYKAIFEHYYRLDDKTQFSSQVCNWDQYYTTSTPIVPDSSFMMIYRRPWNFDYFYSIYWSPIVSTANLQSILPYSQYSDLSSVSTIPVSSGGSQGPLTNADISQFTSDVLGSYSESDHQRAYATASIRQMFANEKLAMITGRSRKNYDSQILAHYGISVPHDVKHELTLIGHDEYNLRIGEVTSLASTDDAPLGELAGKGWASSREEGNKPRIHKFTAPVHGVIMTIFSVEPLKRYYGGFERQNAVVDAFDLPVPEFDRLGNMPMFRYEVGAAMSPLVELPTDIVGWKERYYQWKRRSPKCTLAFLTGTRGQGQNNYESYMLASRPFAENDAFNVYSATSFLRSDPDNENRFYIPFNALDTIMLQNYGYGFAAYREDVPDAEDWDINPHLVYVRDPFIVDCKPTVKKVSWMSKDGEPVYPY